MSTQRPPTRTLRYRIRTETLPADLSNTFFGATQVLHTKCFSSGPYIIVGLASEADRDAHMSRECTEKLKRLGFDLVEPPEQISARTILARRIDEYLLKRDAADLKNEIEERNGIQIDELHIIPKANAERNQSLLAYCPVLQYKH